jgi:3',5'-cyclic-nucleotide phosphodiesterase
MGNICVPQQTTGRLDLLSGNVVGSGSFRTTLAAVPKLFCEVNTLGTKLYVTCHPNENYKALRFACTDSKKLFYRKDFSQDDMREVRDQLGVPKKVDELQWWSFFNSMKNAFYNNKVGVQLQDSDAHCMLKIELQFSTAGKLNLNLKLHKISNNLQEEVVNNFVVPLYEVYTQNRTTPSKLEHELKLAKEKLEIYKQQIEKKSSASTTTNRHHDEIKIEVTTEDNEKAPISQVIQYIKEIKKNLVKEKNLTTSEYDSFNRVLTILNHDEKFKPIFGSKDDDIIDDELCMYLKQKFSIDEEQRNKFRRLKKKIEQTIKEDPNAAKKNPNVQKTKLKLDIVSEFDRVDSWNFDVFKLTKLTNDHTLFITGYALFVKYDLLNKFNIPEKVLINWLKEIEKGYHPNPYHTAMHAADVLQVLHYIIYKGGLSAFMSDEDVLASLISAIIHDYDHPGLNNTFQINSSSYLAILYNDRAVLENHHCSQSFELMRNKNLDILQGLTPEQRKEVRETIIQMVLSTDMSQHAKIIGKFKNRLENDADFSSKDDVRLALQVAIKIADVSNPGRPPKLYLKWAVRIFDEFYQQGDAERNLGILVSPFMDRHKPALAKGQVAFINYIVAPMFESFASLLPNMKFTAKHVSKNKGYWSTHEDIDEKDIEECDDDDTE